MTLVIKLEELKKVANSLRVVRRKVEGSGIDGDELLWGAWGSGDVELMYPLEIAEGEKRAGTAADVDVMQGILAIGSNNSQVIIIAMEQEAEEEEAEC